MKRNLTICLTAVTMACLLCAGGARGADVLSDATTTDDVSGRVTFTPGANGSITVAFAEQAARSMPQYTAATVVAGTTSGDPTFSGDYIASEVTQVSFTIKAETTVTDAADVMLVLRSGVSGRVWRNENVTVSAQGGVTVANDVSFERSSGWTRDGGGDLDAMWAEDLQSVEIIGVRLAQPAREAMAYTVADFKISGAFGTTTSVLTPLEIAMKNAFGVTSITELTDAQKALDSDGDGMEDVFEIFSENDENFANSIFMAEIVSITDAGVLIKWPCVAGSRYTVIRAESLTEAFTDLPGAISLPCTETGYMTHLDTSATGDGPYYYKIRREP